MWPTCDTMSRLPSVTDLSYCRLPTCLPHTERREKASGGWGIGCSPPVAHPHRRSQEQAAAVGISGAAEESEGHAGKVSLSQGRSTYDSVHGCTTRSGNMKRNWCSNWFVNRYLHLRTEWCDMKGRCGHLTRSANSPPVRMIAP